LERVMLPLAPDALAENLHQCNARLGACLSGLISGDNPASLPARSATPHHMASLLSELMRAGECLRSMPREKGPALQKEVSVYRKNVERLRELLPSIHATLLRERARLEQERARVGAAGEWARSSRQTL
jgi:hypothetical protein